MSEHKLIEGPILPRDFYEREVVDVATDVLGSYLVHRVGSVWVGGRIVEVEAYGGPGDPGSHADKAPDGRARIMFGPPGRSYVYFTYGMHHCMNAVTGPEGRASAILFRALEPIWSVPLMRKRGFPQSLPDHLLCSGPGRLCKSLSIDRTHNGRDLTRGGLVVRQGSPATVVHTGLRIGLSADDGRKWRFWTDSASVSNQRGSTKRKPTNPV